MEKDLLVEMGFDEEAESEEDTDKDSEEDIENLGDRINDLQLQVENVVKEEFDVPTTRTLLNNDDNNIDEVSVASCTQKENNIENICERNDEVLIVENEVADQECSKHASNDLPSETNIANTHKQLVSNVEDSAVDIEDYFDTKSIRSVSSAATIAPDMIKRRTKLALNKRERKGQSKNIIAKGEANAATRIRRDNVATIKESTGIWGWE